MNFSLAFVEDYLVLINMAQILVMEEKFLSVLSQRMAMVLYCLSLQKKFSIKCRHLYISLSISRGCLRCGLCEITIFALRLFISLIIQSQSKALSTIMALK